MSEKYLNMQFNQFGPISQVVVDRERGHALVFFEQISCAQAAVKEMRGAALRGRRLQVDFASRECQETFYEHLERQGIAGEKPWDTRPSPATTFDVSIPSRRERSSFDTGMTVSNSSSRFTRYETPPRSRTASYSRTSGGGSTPGASPAHPTAMSRSSRRSYQDTYYDGDYSEPAPRRFRSYDEFSQGSGASHDDYQSSVLGDGKLNDDDCPPPSRRHAVQSVVTSVEPPAPPPPLLPPPDIRHLQKERVHLLEQLEECHSSGDEVGFAPKKRAKLDGASTTILCEDDEPEIASLLVTSHSSRKGMDIRRVSDSKVVVHHGTRRGSCEGRGPGPCKRRRDVTSRHHEHHDGSRPGTPLVDERPENLVPSEPRRFRERSHEGPLSLPLPRFAAQMLNNNNNNNNNTSSSNNNSSGSNRSSNVSLAKVASPPCANLSTVPSPRTAPQPPASPPPRHLSPSPTSSDSETAPQSPSLEERIRSLDEKYEKWSGSRALSAAGGDALAKLDATASERFRFRHKLLDLDLHEVQPSDIVKSVLAKRSVFDEDSKRLENFSEKYEPREFTGVLNVGSMIGSTSGLASSGGCTSKVCLQYPFPSHPPVQLTGGGSAQIGMSASLSSLTFTTTMSSALKTDPRTTVQHNCVHPTPATPITPGTSIKTVSPELPPVSLPIGLGSGTAASSGNSSGLTSASSILSSNGSVSSIHVLGASTSRGLTTAATSTPTATTASIVAFPTPTPMTTTSVTATAATTTTTTSTTPATTTASSTVSSSSSQYQPSMSSAASTVPPSSTTSSSNSSCSSSSSSSVDSSRSRLRKEIGGSRESRDSRDSKDGRDSKYSKNKDCQRKSRKEDADVERSRKDREEKDSLVNDVVESDGHAREFKENKEVRYERKEREEKEKERREKDDRERQERREKEDRDRQERKEREERREKDEERRERERLDKERHEKDKREREERERERKEREESEAKEKERREKERLEREKREREEKERQERREREERERREREDRDRKERELRLEREKQEKERVRKEREEQERREKEERDRRREEKERLDRERKREREEKERLERERRKEKEERERAEKEKREKEERERFEREKHDREKRRDREDQERREKEKSERDKRRDRDDKDKDKRDRDESRRQPTENHLHQSVSQSQNQISPAPVSIKRRCSSQDGPTEDEAKRMKISEHWRDRPRQNRRSEDRKHRNDSHRSSRDSRESRDSKESSSGSTQAQDSRETSHGELNRESNRESRENNRDSGKEKQRSKKNRSEKESRERSPRVSHESDKEFLSRLELSKRNDSNSPSEQTSVGSNHSREIQQHHQQQSSMNLHSDVDDPLSTHDMEVTRHPLATDTDSDEPKKHSIFDIVDDEPAYISMYDKVKARSTKNMQKLEEEKRQVRLKDKFSQLKQSRARREEKKQSTSWDGDSVSSKALTEDEATSESDSARAKSLSRKGSRSRIHSDTSEEDESFNNKIRKVKTERFLESDVDLGFADTEEKHNPLETSTVVVSHATVKEEPRTSDDDERISVAFRGNHPAIVVNNHERDSRKKSHKKKQKRQKNSMSTEDSLKNESSESIEHKNKSNIVTGNTECRPNHTSEPAVITTPTTPGTTVLENTNEERIRSEKKQRNKKDKRRDRNGDEKTKARRKRLNRQEVRDSQRMEDIFGPLSDDVDDGPSNTFFNHLGNMAPENNAYATDSDGGHSPVLDVERVRRKTEKKRRHQPEDENSVDLAEAGREIEAKLLGLPNSPKSGIVCTENNDHDVFRFTDDNDSVEPSTPSTVPEKVKEKKKKRKKSKEERSRKDYHHHHHHHHHHHEKSGELPYLGADPSPPRASSPLITKTMSPTLPSPRDTLLSPIPKVTSSVATVPSMSPPVASGGIQSSKPDKKKDKFIPGFGIEIDETIHENAVKSISEPEEREGSCQPRSGREETDVAAPTTPPAQTEDKPRVAISQEETEDAVAALLEETFGGSTEDFSYEGEEEDAEVDDTVGQQPEAPQEDVEEMQQAVESLNASAGEGETDLKPDTPQSEHDLQIDTDTEEDPNYETFDLTQPPKTPDIPSFYKSPTKTISTVAAAAPPSIAVAEKPVETRIAVPAKPQSPPASVIAHSWNLNEKPREVVKAVQQLETTDTTISRTSPERITTQQAHRVSTSPPPQYKQPALGPCSVPITSETPRIAAASPRPPNTVQSLYQKLPVSPQSQMVPMRQASPRMQNISTVSSSAASNLTPLPPLVPSRIPPLVPSQLSPRVSQPLSPNGQWSRNPSLSPHVPNVGKPSPPPARIAVSATVSSHRPETPSQQIYSTAATQQPVIQHAPGMRALAPSYPRGGLPPLTLNIPHRPYMPVKSSRDSALGGKSVIETLLPVNPNEPPQRLEEPKLSPAVIPEPTNKASTSPKVPSPNQPPTYIPETAKIEINASTSSPVFGKPTTIADTCTLTSRSQKQMPGSITTDNNLLSPRQKQELSSLQLLTTHVPRSSTPSPVIVAHGQSHLVHKSVVHSIGASTVATTNQPLIKTVVPIVSQQIAPTVPVTVPEEKCIISQTLPLSTAQRHSPVSQGNQIPKPHIPLVSTVSQAIITRAAPSVVSAIPTPAVTEQTKIECLEPPEQELEVDPNAQMTQTAQPMQLTPPIQPTQPMDIVKDEPVEVKHEETPIKEEFPSTESEFPLKQPCANETKPKIEQSDPVKVEKPSCIPKVEATENIVPKVEIETVKSEPVSEIKEEEITKENEEPEIEEEPAEDPLKEPSTDPLAIDVSKEDPADSKEDSDYWSAKEVNIESVIKKVDALCDGEGNDGDEETQHGPNLSNETQEQPKNEPEWFGTEPTENESKKNFSTNDEQDEGVETCESESTRSRRSRTKNRRGVSSRGGVTTRRSVRNTTTFPHKRGSKASRGSKHHVEKNKLPADVYEFHDDSEEDNAGRPRLILTIKSPVPSLVGSNAQPATPIAAVKEVPPEEFVSPAANTRKSKRLAERDGSRNTIDDVIEDVVRGSAANKGLAGGTTGVHATRRSTRHNNAPRNVQSTVQLTEPRKSTRGGRKSIRRTSENNDDSSEEKVKEVPPPPPEPPSKEEVAPVRDEPPKVEETSQPNPPPTQKPLSHEPMTLIDPVTGMLIPMRESEEGQYIPVSTAAGQIQAATRAAGMITANATTEALRPKPPQIENLTKPEESKKEQTVEPVQTPQIQPQTSVITKPQSPAVQVTSTASIVQTVTTSTTVACIPATTVATTITAPPICTTQPKPTSLKAHVLNASKLVTPPVQQQIVITKPTVPSVPSQSVVQNIVKPTQAVQGLHLQIPSGRVVSPSLSPRTKQAPQISAANGKSQGQPMSPVLNNTGVPPNPKQHLLQAAKQQASTIVNLPQKLPMNVHPASVTPAPTPRIHQPVSQPTALKGINGQPHPMNPKAHLLQAVVPPIVAGAVASPPTQPHLMNPQPVGVNCSRLPAPKPPVTGTMEPPKVEVSMSGCIMVPTASPQSRGVPISSYDGPLHGSAGAAPSPGGQYGLVPPHRSQSPPLPPPAHHHANASQGDVVNHYGGLTRGGELPPHYMHPQVLQYQYLRAQQEALTAPRIAYHIPGTRSPHLPLDPKLETGIEDSHSPPLELRRSTRTPQDRTTDSPQVAQVYMLHGAARLPPPPPQYNAGTNPTLTGAPAAARGGFYEPPPAHLRSQYPIAASEAPSDRAITPDRPRKHQVVTPPHASQVPPQADSFQMLLQRYPVMWQGLLALKNDQAAVQMHFVFGNPNVARDSLPCNSDGSTPPLRIAQRMRLEQTQVEGVARKMQMDNEHCMLLALPCGRDEVDVLQQSKNLQTGFIMYLQQKQAAGIVNIAAPGSQQPAYVVHIFPSCDFANESLARIAPDLLHRVAKIAHLLIVIATV
ncbi:uncharacterized protein LOC143344622 isoform X6 [Colletes latitarsis]